jgi:hypothetical protein
VSRKAIGPDPADEKEEDERQRACREHEADVGLRSCDVQDGKDKCDGCDSIAERGRGAPEEQEQKLPLPQRLEAGLQAAAPMRLRL